MDNFNTTQCKEKIGKNVIVGFLATFTKGI